MAPVSGEDEGRSETIGQRLRRLRLERGLSQRQLAAPGVSYAYISRIEGGARRPSVKALRTLARKLGISADYLETGSEITDDDARELRIADAELELRLAESTEAAEQQLEQLREEALHVGDVLAAARAEIALGLAAARAGRNSEAIARLEGGVELAQLSASARPDVFATLGRTYAAAGRPDRAVELFERCLEEVTDEAPDDISARLRFTTYLSYALTDGGDLERAQALLDAALAEAEELTDAYSRVRLYWSLARLNDIQGRSAAALDYIRRAIALLDVTDDTVHLGRAHLLCGSILLSQGRLDDAARHYDTAERLFGAAPAAEDRVNLLTDRAKLALGAGRAEEAVRLARAALEAAGDEYPQEKGNALLALAEGLSLDGDAVAANEAFQRATALLEQHGHRRDCVDAYRAWGTSLRRVGRAEEALEMFERADDLTAERAGADTSARS
jgi:tetratricopeptide (TPR) repeat protein